MRGTRVKKERKLGIRHQHELRGESSELTGKHTVPDRKGRRVPVSEIIAKNLVY